MTIYNLQFSVPAKYITTLRPNYVSEKGPYIVAYLGRINKKIQMVKSIMFVPILYIIKKLNV